MESLLFESGNTLDAGSGKGRNVYENCTNLLRRLQISAGKDTTLKGKKKSNQFSKPRGTPFDFYSVYPETMNLVPILIKESR